MIRQLVLSSLCLLLLATSSAALDMRELIRDIEDQHTGRSSIATMEMTVRTEHWERSLSMKAWSLGRDHFLIRILKPAKEKGVATLKVDKEVWNYLPKIDRTIKVPASMMGGAWMGSHITNNDLVKAAKIDEDYTFELLGEDDTTWTVDCIPRPEAAVVWGRIVYTVEKARRVPLTVDYFDEEQEKVRTMTFDRVKTIGKRTLPLRMTIIPLDKPDEKTVFTYHDIAFDVPMEESFFSLANLQER
ncbi:MAG: outer membrane lipoprotein-sorting protein [Desulfuromonas sp.]|nr:MAG: outer membrane lipoprotein-sorting protein [Desulfuromonas sp.]